MSELLVDVGSVSSWIFSMILDVCSTVVENPILLLVTGVMMAGAVIGIFGRLLSRG